MTDQHPAHPTKPLTVGAPLPEADEGRDLAAPNLVDIAHEMRRAEVELLYAAAKHRKAWKAMRQVAKERDERAGQVGMLSTLESDPHWKKAVGDVAWWRDEMNAQANVVLALRNMSAVRIPRAY